MTWSKISDTFHHHPKPMKVDLAALGLFTLGLSYASDNLTDGWLPAKWVKQRLVDEDESLPDQLVQARMWDRREDGDYEIHDYLDYNWSREKVLSERDKEKNKKRRQRESTGVSPRDTTGTLGTGTGPGTGSATKEKS